MFGEPVGGSTDSCNRCNFSGLRKLSQYFSSVYGQQRHSETIEETAESPSWELKSQSREVDSQSLQSREVESPSMEVEARGTDLESQSMELESQTMELESQSIEVVESKSSELESVSTSFSPKETNEEHEKSTFLEYLNRISFRSNTNSIDSWLYSSLYENISSPSEND